MELNELLVMIRATKNMSQTDLAEAIGVSYATISRWESGKAKPTSTGYYKLKQYCKENDIDMEENKYGK